MSSTTVLDPATADAATHRERARTASARIPLSRLVGVELRKMFDTRSGFWLMASILITSVLATAAIIVFAPDDQQTYDNFAAAVGIPMTVILPIIGILAVTSEWSQRSGLTTFTLVPHRGRVLWAKFIAAVGVGVVGDVRRARRRGARHPRRQPRHRARPGVERQRRRSSRSSCSAACSACSSASCSAC